MINACDANYAAWERWAYSLWQLLSADAGAKQAGAYG